MRIWRVFSYLFHVMRKLILSCNIKQVKALIYFKKNNNNKKQSKKKPKVQMTLEIL
jgi:hypothetical protein